MCHINVYPTIVLNFSSIFPVFHDKVVKKKSLYRLEIVGNLHLYVQYKLISYNLTILKLTMVLLTEPGLTVYQFFYFVFAVKP